MKKNKNRICVLGDGGWGTTLAIILAQKGHTVTLWSAFPQYAKYLQEKRDNKKFLPGIKIPSSITVTGDLEKALFKQELYVLAIPSQYLRSTLLKVKTTGISRKPLCLSVVKGIEIGSLKRMSEVIHEILPEATCAVLSGPTIAHEVAIGIPTTAVVAAHELTVRKRLQDVFMTDEFRVYTNADVIGVELGGSLKNVIAIACGISDGLGFGTNTKAALLSRGLSEISRLGHAMGAKVKTFSGISGLGDLVTTCISSYSRNRFVGEQIGKGKTLEQVKSNMQMVAEGVPTAQSAFELGRQFHVEIPIISEVYHVLYHNKSPLKAVKDLMKRKKKEE